LGHFFPRLTNVLDVCGKNGTGWQGKFAHCVIVYFGQFFEKYRFFWLLFPRLRSWINDDRTELGYILGDFFINASGHPAGWSKWDLEPIL
jgi:hypothetical protein